MSLLWLRFLLLHEFDLWPRNFCKLWVQPQKKKASEKQDEIIKRSVSYKEGRYYGLHVCAPPNSCVRTLMLIVMVLEEGDIGRWLGD